MNTHLPLPLATISSCQLPLIRSYNGTSKTKLVIIADIRRHERQRQSRRVPNPSDNKTEIIIDIRHMRQRAVGALEDARRASEATVRRIVQIKKGLWKDLRTSVTVFSHNDQRFVLVVRRSSLQFLANALICSVFVVVAYKWMRRWLWDWDANVQGIMRMDRSLGGREVVVSRGRGGRALNSKSYSNIREGFNSFPSPLASARESRSERELMKQPKKQEKERKEAAALPGWWPPPDIPPKVSSEDYKSALLHAKALLKAIMNHRMSGMDFSKEDILQLRQICKTSGVTVSFETANVRDSFYRASIAFVLTVCSSSSGSTLAQIDGEEATRFISGLAGNIGLKADRAAIMVNAAVAAQTRSSFMQAWAFIVQGKNIEAQELFLKLSRIHTTFPPEINSPEIEMVAEGLKRHLQLEERKQLLNMFTEVCRASNQRVALEALGLVSTWKGTDKYFST